jgi:hypothetical protein
LAQAAIAVAAPNTGEFTGILQVSPAVLPAFNTRVKLRPLEFEVADADGKIYSIYNLDEDDHDEEMDVPDRESMKKHTMQLVNSKLKTKQVKKPKKKRSSKEDDD